MNLKIKAMKKLIQFIFLAILSNSSWSQVEDLTPQELIYVKWNLVSDLQTKDIY